MAAELSAAARGTLADTRNAADQLIPLHEDEQSPAGPIAMSHVATMPWDSVGAVNQLTSFRVGVGVPGMPFQSTVTVAHSGSADDPTEVEWRDVRVLWEIEPCGDPDLAEIHDFGQVVSAPDLFNAASVPPGAVAPQVSAVLEVPAAAAECPGDTVQITPVLQMVDHGSGEVDTQPSRAGYVFLLLVPGLNAAALCAPVCSGTGGLTQPTSTRGAGVNTATGAYTTGVDDATVPSPQIPFELSRASAPGVMGGVLGPGWMLPWETQLDAEDDGDVVLREESGGRLTFTLDDEEYVAPSQRWP